MNIEHFQQAIADILLSSAQPIKEFDLIQQLQQSPYELLSKEALRGDLQLFRTHFLVFHCLYQLQTLWRTERAFELRIDPLHIELQTYQASPVGLAKEDPLQSYYSHWENMTDTTQDDVERLLNSFWQGFADVRKVSSSDVAKALEELGLDTIPDGLSVLRNHYRRLVHLHHPDKGGDVARMQAVQQAYTVLRNYLA